LPRFLGSNPDPGQLHRPAPAAPRPVGRVVRLFRPYRRQLTGLLGLILVSAGLGIVSPFLLREVLDEATFPFWEKARARGAEFRVETSPELPSVHVHRPHVQEALRQVLDNAFKFADPQSPCVVLRAGAEGGQAEVLVSNNGPGIPDHQRGVLFQKLAQVDREIHEQQGSGLGLYITKQLVDMNRGAIELRSEPGRGVEIEIRLPTSPPSPK